MNDCEVFCTSRTSSPTFRATFGSCSGPKNMRAAAPSSAISGIESIRRVSSRPRVTAHAPLLKATGKFLRAGGALLEDHLYPRQPDGDPGVDCHAPQDSQPLRCSPRLLRGQLPKQARARV